MIPSRPRCIVPPLVLCLALTLACSSNPEPPGPGETWGAVPDLRGHRVLLLPTQLREGVARQLTPDPELAHALGSRGETVDWVLPAETRRALDRSPGMGARMRGLPVGIFLQAQVRRIGDPLFRDIRRLAELTGAEVVLIPVEIRYGENGAYEVAAALVNGTSGRVYWFGVIQGDEGPPGDAATLASMADALALALLPLG